MGIKIDTKQNNMTPFNFDRLHESQGDKKKKGRRIKKSSKTHDRLKPHHKKRAPYHFQLNHGQRCYTIR
jgi:hypothetical protein